MEALIVDDELHCRDNLSLLIKSHCSEISNLRQAVSVDEAAAMFEQSAPDILFLDIQMPGKNGFQLLKMVDTSSTSIIFTTAFDEYAIQSIKSGPTAYLLKPIDLDELKEAIELSKQNRFHKMESGELYQSALQDLGTVLDKKEPITKVCLIHNSKLQIVKISEIIYLSADNYYTTFYLESGEKIVMSKTLKYYESILGNSFLRPHRSYLVNENFVREFNYYNGAILMSNKAKIPVSRRKTTEIINHLKNIN